jgi:adenylate cyclase class 1
MELAQITDLFNRHNHSRIEWLSALAPENHKQFFDLLPLIFQTNDPALPAYIEGVPKGIRGYKPTDELISKTKKSYSSFASTHQAFVSYPLEGIYLLNEAGYLNYPEQPSFVLWVVYSEANAEAQQSLLKNKLKEVIVWAKKLGITITGRIFNDTALAQGLLTSEELDQFYCTGLIMAGATPLWWYLNPEQEQNYAEHATAVFNALPNDIIALDFGPLTNRMPTHLISQAIEAVSHCIEENLAGYLSLLFNAMLLEQFPKNLWLADEYKKQVYSDQRNSFLCDPNILRLKLIESYLGETQILSAQRSFYLMVNEHLSTPTSQPKYPWRRQNMTELVEFWLWDKTNITQLDKRANARIRARLSEFEQTKKQVTIFCKQLQQFIKQFAPDEINKFAALQKTVQETFDSAPNIISKLPESLAVDTPESQLYLGYDRNKQQWSIDDTAPEVASKNKSHRAIFAHESITFILAWSIHNGALSKYTQVRLTSNDGAISNNGALDLLNYLHKSALAGYEPTINAGLTWIMFANMQDTPKEAYKQIDVKLSLYQRDPLNYSYHRRNLLTGIEVIAINNDQKWYYFNYQNSDAASEAMANLVRWQVDPSQNNQIESWCPTINFSDDIVKRLNTLAKNICTHYQHNNDNGAYIFEVGDRFARINWNEGTVEAVLSGRSNELADTLSYPRSSYCETKLDPAVDRDGLYFFLLQNYRANQLNVFIHSQPQHIDVYIADELGHLFKQTFKGLRENTLINNFQSFLSEVVQQNNLESLTFYNLRFSEQTWSKKIIKLDEDEGKKTYLPVKVKMREPTANSDCNINCGNQNFRGKANDPELFLQVYELVTKMRNSNINYPLYINSISFVGDKPYGSYYYIKFKQRLEQILNRS